VDNTGGRAIDLNGTARLADGPGNSSSGPFPAQKIVTLAPGQSSNLTFLLPKSLPDGTWQATVSLASGLTSAVGKATIRFAPLVKPQASLSAMQWIWVGLGGLALVLSLVMGRYAWQQRRRQVPAWPARLTRLCPASHKAGVRATREAHGTARQRADRALRFARVPLGRQ
jgi:hypothetical protein